MSEDIKRMADLLKSGASMLSESCPECHTPLFRKDEQIFCPKCNRPVVIVRSPKEEEQLNVSMILSNLERTILKRIKEADTALNEGSDSKETLKTSSTIVLWLTILEKLKRLK